uniref:Uncharacterized protein n=1 Tax=Rousettus aegyptiacus TaxID=9407 RepID=A0A7J8FJ47_ROUAE|nr:hypothetical protein HJG63_012019 [Rousettus aegyptiacus]
MRARRPMLPVSCQSRRQGGAPLLSLAPPRYNPASLSMQGLQTAEAGATAHCPLATLVSTSRAAPRNPEPQSNDGGRWGWQPAEAVLRATLVLTPCVHRTLPMTYLLLSVLTFSASVVKTGSCWTQGRAGKVCEARVSPGARKSGSESD